MDSPDDLLSIRRAKVEALRALGVDPFGRRFDTDGPIGEIRAGFVEGRAVRVAGRLVARRDMGKSRFCDLADVTGRIQIYLRRDEIAPECMQRFDLVDLGDFLGVEGETFVTRAGEPTVRVRDLTILSKALRPLPDKWHGLADVERRHRQRYLDLVANPHSREIFRTRSALVREVREFLHGHGFLEVETPMMQAVAGGAASRPFQTHHNALGLDLFLRIAPELALKRLLVGGFDRVFELNRNFRNEGISRRHNPEFTMLEAYWAYADCRRVAELVEEMICHLAQTFCGSLRIEHRDEEGTVRRTIDLTPPWRRARYRDLVEEADPGWFALTPEARRRRALELGVEIGAELADHEVTQQLFEKRVEERTIDPLFVTHVPSELIPLARPDPADPTVLDVFELIINGVEIAPGYTELNDPIAQRERLERQAGREIQSIDEDFLLALEHGMPPAGGIGVGIDRLVMLLTGADSIRDVILFPLLKPRDEGGEAAPGADGPARET